MSTTALFVCRESWKFWEATCTYIAWLSSWLGPKAGGHQVMQVNSHCSAHGRSRTVNCVQLNCTVHIVVRLLNRVLCHLAPSYGRHLVHPSGSHVLQCTCCTRMACACCVRNRNQQWLGLEGTDRRDMMQVIRCKCSCARMTCACCVLDRDQGWLGLEGTDWGDRIQMLLCSNDMCVLCMGQGSRVAGA